MTNYSVAILGGGFYGSLAAQKLAALKTQHSVSITLFTLHEYATMLPATVRLVTGGFKTEDLTTEYSTFLDKNVDLKIVREITEFDEKSVTYVLRKSSKPYTANFDFIIIATGLKWYDPIQFSSIDDPTIAGFSSYNLSFQKKVAAAHKIVIAGGGEVGCELAGELGYTFLDDLANSKKEVYLIHSSDKLLNGRVFEKVRNKVFNHFKKVGIKVILNEKVDLEKSRDDQVSLSDGTVIKDVDVFFKTTGPTPNLPKNKLDLVTSEGYVTINEHLQTKIATIFAIGDIADLLTKTLLFKDETINVLIHNIVQQMDGKKDFKKFTKFIGSTEPLPVCVVSLGPEASAGQAPIPLLGTVNVPSFVTTKVKSKYLLTNHMLESFSINKR